jgi:hypothetical protein
MNRAAVAPGEIVEAYQQFDDARQRRIMEWHDLYKSAIRLGVEPSQVVNDLVQIAGRKNAEQILAGKPTPYMLSEESAEELVAGRPNGGDRLRLISRLYQERLE